MKRLLIITAVVILVALAGYFYFNTDSVPFVKDTSYQKAIPVSAPAFVELKSLGALESVLDVIPGLAENEDLGRLLQWAADADSLIRKTKNIQNSLRNAPLVIVLDFVGGSQVYPLFIGKAESNNTKKSLENFFNVMFPSNLYKREERNYSDYQIIALNSVRNGTSVFYSFSEGLFLFSTRLLLVEESLRQLNTDAQNDLGRYAYVREGEIAPVQPDICLYVNHKAFSDIPAGWFSSTSKYLTNEFGETVRRNYHNSVRDLLKFATWSTSDISVGKGEMTMEGQSLASDSLHQFLSVFNGQDPVRSRAAGYLPENTTFYFSCSFSNGEQFFERLESYFMHKGAFYRREARINKIEGSLRSNVRNSMARWAKNEVTLAFTSVPGSKSVNTFFIVPTNNSEQAETEILSMLSANAAKNGIQLDSLKKEVVVNSENKVNIYPFPFPSFPGILLGKPYDLVDANFVLVYKDNIVFSNTIDELQDYCEHMNGSMVLEENTGYRKLRAKNPGRSNIRFYIDANKIQDVIKEMLDSDAKQFMSRNEQLIGNLLAIEGTISNENGKFTHSVEFSVFDPGSEEGDFQWEVDLGRDISMKPQFVFQKVHSSQKDIVVQDGRNRLYLVASDGSIRWSYPVGEPVMSEIHQVDYFQNGKLQYLFNTKNKLYLIDQEGKDVAHFPVEFSSPATNGINVFDYDGTRNYRIFIAFENRRVVAFDIQGNVVEGWLFEQTAGEVTTPVQHFRIRNRDYIVFKDHSHVYIQNRRGETRVPCKTEFDHSDNPIVLCETGTPKLAMTDVNGNVYYIYFDGKTELKGTFKLYPKHLFTISDLDGDAIPDFILANKKELIVQNENGQKLFSLKFDNLIEFMPEIYDYGAAGKMVGVVDSKSNRLYLYDCRGNLYPGFPLRGNSPFSIGKLHSSQDKLNLVTGEKGGDLISYMLN